LLEDEEQKFKNVPEENTREKHIDDEAEKRLYKLIQDYKDKGKDGWKINNNCAHFAAEAWKVATGEDFTDRNEDFPLLTPTKLKMQVQKANKNGYSPKPPPTSLQREATLTFEPGIN
jgi:hypothetical protein